MKVGPTVGENHRNHFEIDIDSDHNIDVNDVDIG